MENLHIDILENILFRLPVKTALLAKRVCTTWREILRSKTEKPGFLFAFSREAYGIGLDQDNIQFIYEDEYDHTKINNYYTYHRLTKIRRLTDFEGNVMVGSCNGLICFGKNNILGNHGINPFRICNPLTGESVCLPKYNYSRLPRYISSTWFSNGCLASGFGYCPWTNEYKVVTIYYHPGEHKGHVQVYTVGGEWRYVELIGRSYIFDGYSSGIYANGALHWLPLTNKVQDREIVAFDLEAEKFRYIQLPVPSEDSNYKADYNKLLGGNNNLYLVHTNSTPFRIDIWTYKRNNMDDMNIGIGKSSSHWIKEFSIQPQGQYCINPFAITRSNKVLLWYKRYTTSGRRLYCYDPKTSTLIKLWNNKFWKKCEYIEAVPHTQSIVSLKDLGEKNVTCRNDVTKIPTRGTRKREREKNLTRWRDAKII